MQSFFFYLEKSYDTSWPYSILKDLSLQSKLPIFIKHFLDNWIFQTWINNTFSNSKPQEIGVPQGSILSGILFITRTNKITTCLPPEIDGFLICYNSKIMATIERKIQQCIKKISKWTVEKGFKISNNKTKACTSAKSTKCIINPPWY